MNSKPQIAIVGMGGVFPGASDLDRFWDNIINGRDLTREPPPGRWLLSLADAYDSSGPLPDKVYSKRACFVEDLILDKTGLDIDDGFLAQLDPMFRLLLQAGGQAWRDAVTDTIDRQRTGIIIGNIALPTDASSALADELLGAAIDQRLFGQGNSSGTVNRLNRYVAGLPAAILARALGLGGGSHTLDAACASSLYAVKFAMDELQAGRADAMLAGGLSRPDSLYTQMGFSSLHAISASGRCAPFDHRADGLVVGEGCGMLLLKRLDDAVAAGDRIYAVLKGTGLSNDIGGNLMSPDSEGQLRAMRAAYRQAGWQPADIDLIECHGTGTPVGDVVEFNSLNSLWRDQRKDGKCVIGSVKSNIGHLLTAAGAAGLIKVLLAMQHGRLPPTANFEQPNPNIDIHNSPFTVLEQAGEWRQRDQRTPRRAAVSAFGFGGINAHLLLEQWQDRSGEAEPVPAISSKPGDDAIAIIGMDAAFGPWQSLAAFRQRTFGGDPETQPRLLGRWWGVNNENNIRGYAVDQVDIPVGRFRIPPNELKDMLPQQLLMLQVAANAIEDAGLATDANLIDAGVYIGIGLDLNTTNFHIRWSLLDKCRRLAKQLQLQPAEDQLQQWTADLRDAFCPPLTANRTMGALGGIVASRVARAFNVGGPSFTVSAEETSGLRSLEAGVRALQRREINTAITGAVDLASDVRAALGQGGTRPWSGNGLCRPFDDSADGAVTGDGAAALVLKRLADARRDGDRVYAVIKGIGSAGGGAPDAVVPPAAAYRRAVANAVAEANIETGVIGYIEAQGSGCPEEDRLEAAALIAIGTDREHNIPCAIGSVKADIGHCGAAGGMAAVVRTALALQQHILPPLRNLQRPLAELQGGETGLFIPRHGQYWLRNKARGPRHALVNTIGIGGNCSSAVLAEDASPAAVTVSNAAVSSLPGLFSVTGNDQAELLRGLDKLADSISPATPELHRLAAAWYHDGPAGKDRLAVSLVSTSVAELASLIERARARVSEGCSCADGNVYYSPEPLGRDTGIAFVFPGSGNHFHGMGREAAACWPQVLNRLDDENDYLADQFAATKFWTQEDNVNLSHKDVIFGQVWLGTMMSDIVSAFGIRPAAVIGYSLGETAGLFATRAWTDRDLMLQRITASDLFIDELAGACNAARTSWGLDSSTAVDWLIGVVDCPADRVREKLQGRERVYLLIINTETESVVGGDRAAVTALAQELGCHFHPINGVTTVHCEVVQPVSDAYRDLHLFDTSAPAGIRYYSGILGRTYDLNRDSAADSITGQALHYFDYPRVVNSAYADGIRIYIEMGPGATCSRMIDQILGDRKHVARAVCIKGQSESLQIVRLLAQLNTERVPLDLTSLYEEPPATSRKRQDKQVNVISVPVGKEDLKQLQAISHKLQEQHSRKTKPAEVIQLHDNPVQSSLMEQLIEQAARTDTARAEAQAAFLRVANGISQSLAQAWSAQAAYLQSLPEGTSLPPFRIHTPKPDQNSRQPAALYDRAMCMEFATGSIARVLGEQFAEADSFPTRVRLPDEPLMLVDRILEVEGDPCSMTAGRVVTEHDVLADDWYLDGGRIPTCIAVESGQADLFLSGYLGIDLQTRGLAVYRLLDAEVTFHAPLPQPGRTIRYDIHIDHFFRQGDTWLFRFHFDGTVDGQPLISMRNGCAGFFSPGELEAGRGIVLTSLEKRPLTGKRPDDWTAPAAMEKTSYNDMQIEALRNGDLAGCFGPAFADLPLRNPAGLPGGRMTLVHRVLTLDPDGGRYGIGSITGEADIHPDDWFLTCHFVDDQVMPGTLMYECCLHTLRIYLLRMGWVGETDETAYEPVPGISSKLKCRGQVIATTHKVQYEINLKEYGYMAGGTPYVIADALMYADGRAIVQMTDMSLLLSGLHKDRIDDLWRTTNTRPAGRALFDYDAILAFATGKPSVAFGDRYRVFDEERVIARLPGPPYQFLDRIVSIENCTQWQLQAGGTIEAEYDVPADGWYFDADRQPHMPFAVLLETALQPCGWLAAYLGSALTSDTDLCFRNLGGTATRFLPVTAATGTISTRIRITNVSTSGGMIIQHFDYDLHCSAGRIYRGNTYFGFFTREALANQIGLRDAQLYQPDNTETGRGQQFDYPDEPPYPNRMLRMIDRVALFDPRGGPAGLGFISGTAEVNPQAWFFKAHFYQDPVWPGSLGLESFIQLLKIVACHHWGSDPDTVVFEPMVAGQEHSWVYRGQIIPTDSLVTVQAVIREVDNMEKILRADGVLSVDGRIIYQMKDFTLKLYN